MEQAAAGHGLLIETIEMARVHGGHSRFMDIWTRGGDDRVGDRVEDRENRRIIPPRYAVSLRESAHVACRP